MFSLALLLAGLTLGSAQQAPDAGAIAQYTACIASAVGGNSSLYAFPTAPEYATDIQQEIYNLDNVVAPSAIAFPTCAAEVAALVKCASGAGIAVQPLSGGHSYDNFGLGGANGSLSINLKYLNSIAYDDADQTLSFGTGNLLGALTEYLTTINRTAVFSFIPSIGTGGHFTIGGLGPLSRLYGLAADQIVEAEVVIADGSIVTASEDVNADLFFAIRGAGWSFGIVTKFTIVTREVTQPIPYSYIVPGNFSISAGVITGWQGLIAQKNLSWSLGSTIYIYEGFSLVSGSFHGTAEDFLKVEQESVTQFYAAGVGEITQNALDTADVLAVLDKVNLTATFGLVNDLNTTGLLAFLPLLSGEIIRPLVSAVAKIAPAVKSGNIPAIVQAVKKVNDTTLSGLVEVFQQNATILQSAFTNLRYSGLLDIATNKSDIHLLGELLPNINLTSILELATDGVETPLLSALPVGTTLADIFEVLFTSHTPSHFYAKSLKFTEDTLLTDDGIDDIFKYLDTKNADSPLWFVVFDLAGGAINKVAPDATAYGHRDALYWLQSYIVDLTGPVSDVSLDFLKGLNKEVQRVTPGVDDSAYPGYVDIFLKDPEKAYWGGNVEKLQKIKAEIDENNVFRNPQSVSATSA